MNFFNKYYYKYNPDMVIIAFLINDATNYCSNCGAVKLKRKFDKLVSEQEGKERFGTYAFDDLKLFYERYKLTRATVKEYNDPYERDLVSFQRCKKAFLGFKELSKKYNFKLVVVIYPMLYQLDKNYPFKKIHRKMEKFFEQSGIEAYDLTPAFYGFKDTDLWISHRDSHPNKIANEIAARRIAEIIKGHLKKTSVCL